MGIQHINALAGLRINRLNNDEVAVASRLVALAADLLDLAIQQSRESLVLEVEVKARLPTRAFLHDGGNVLASHVHRDKVSHELIGSTTGPSNDGLSLDLELLELGLHLPVLAIKTGSGLTGLNRTLEQVHTLLLELLEHLADTLLGAEVSRDGLRALNGV